MKYSLAHFCDNIKCAQFIIEHIIYGIALNLLSIRFYAYYLEYLSANSYDLSMLGRVKVVLRVRMRSYYYE